MPQKAFKLTSEIFEVVAVRRRADENTGAKLPAEKIVAKFRGSLWWKITVFSRYNLVL